MKEELLALLPKPVRKLLEQTVMDDENNQALLMDWIEQDANAYGFHPEEVAPCLLAAFYVYESAKYPEGVDEERKRSTFFPIAYRSAFKLLSYGKYHAQLTDSGWMRYAKPGLPSPEENGHYN